MASLLVALVTLFGAAASLGAPGSAAAANGVTVVMKGSCVVAGGVAKNWDVWQEIFETGAPTWLQAHTHQGAECILTLRGITSWWFETSGSPRIPSPVIVPVHKGEWLYTAKGRVHTGGNTGPETMAYLGIHVLEAGVPFRTDVQSTSAPPIQSTALKSYFKTLFPNQPGRAGTFVIANRIEQLAPGGGYERPRSPGDAYFTVVQGSATIVIGAASTTLTQYQSLVIPRNASARISNAASGADETMLAVTELLPKK